MSDWVCMHITVPLDVVRKLSITLYEVAKRDTDQVR